MTKQRLYVAQVGCHALKGRGKTVLRVCALMFADPCQQGASLICYLHYVRCMAAAPDFNNQCSAGIVYNIIGKRLPLLKVRSRGLWLLSSAHIYQSPSASGRLR